MKLAILAVVLLAAVPAAFGQATTPQQQAQQQIEQLIGSLVITNANAQAQIADLKKQLEEAKPAAAEPRPPNR